MKISQKRRQKNCMLASTSWKYKRATSFRWQSSVTTTTTFDGQAKSKSALWATKFIEAALIGGLLDMGGSLLNAIYVIINVVKFLWINFILHHILESIRYIEKFLYQQSMSKVRPTSPAILVSFVEAFAPIPQLLMFASMSKADAFNGFIPLAQTLEMMLIWNNCCVIWLIIASKC